MLKHVFAPYVINAAGFESASLPRRTQPASAGGPGLLGETRRILTFLAGQIGPETYVNVMAQYYPAGKVNTAKYVEINHGDRLTARPARGFTLARVAL